VKSLVIYTIRKSTYIYMCMNIMQYFTKEGLAKYLKDNEITKIVAEPIFENQLNDLAEEVIYFSADEASKAHNEALGKKESSSW